jgi:hypothetical protein
MLVGFCLMPMQLGAHAPLYPEHTVRRQHMLPAELLARPLWRGRRGPAQAKAGTGPRGAP